jgi:Ca-activated chloride channel homolog
MIHFAWPWLALLAPLPWLLYRMRSAAEPRGAAIFLPFLVALGPAAAAAAHRSRGAQIVFAALWLLVLLAAARPQWLGDPLPVPTTGRRLLLAVDVSGSMATPDMSNGSATRLQVVQEVAGRFIDGRHGDQVGLILFGTQPYLQAPLTPDLTTVHRFLDEAVVGVAGPETAIGDAIGLALKRLKASAAANDETGPGSPRETVLLLLTDGESNTGAMPPLEAARLAAQAGLRIYTIGVGAIPSGFFGDRGNTDLDEDTLKAIAKTTGGKYFRAGDVDALRSVYQTIDTLEPAAGREQWFRPAEEWFTLPLTIALVLSIPAAWLGARRWT